MTPAMNEAEKLAERLRTRNGSPTGFGLGPVCDEAASLIERQAEQIKLLREALGKARQDINWMLNSRKFLDGFVFEYIDEALAATKEAG